MQAGIITTILLLLSNVAMTFAWYGHLKFKNAPMWLAIIASWSIAFVEYCLQVPANRIGYEAGISAPTLKVMQEAITLTVFAVFAPLVLQQKLAWNHYAAFALVFGAVFLVSHKW